jgi:tetratricopeptide (TPR) repeat protein
MPYQKIVLVLSAVIVLTALGICARLQASYWNNSANLFTHAIEVTQDNYIAQDYLAHYWRTHGNFARAIEHYKKALQISPDYLDTLFGLGCAFSDQGDLDQATQYFQKLLQLGPHSGYAAYAHVNLGAVLRKQGKLKEACDQFNQALQLSPDFAQAHYEFAIVFFLQGKLDEALNQFRTAVRLKPYWPEPMNDLAWFIATHPEIKNRDVNEAVRLADRACVLTSYRNPVYLGTLAAAYASAGKFSEAVNTAQKAVTLADAANQPKIKNAIQYQLTFYMQGKPYIESPPKHSPAN